MEIDKTVPPAMLRRVVVASVLGNALEWFDFAIFGLFAVIISRLFFPAGDETASLLLTLATFGVGFAVRPLGGVVLGIYGDRLGRKKALSLTILLMAIGTGMMGVLPTYAAVDIAAPILMVLARLIQGFSTGGEFSGATTMLIEFAPRHLRGFYGSFQMCSQALAFSCGALAAYLLTAHLSPASLDAWGWRLPFLFGILIGPVGWIIRIHLDESPEFQAYARNRPKTKRPGIWTSLVDLFANHPREILSSLGICTVGTVSAYVFVFFMPIFAKKQMGLPIADVNLATFFATAVLVVCCPISAYLSDRFGRRAVLFPGILAYGIAAYALFAHFIHSPSYESFLLAQVVIAFFMSFVWGPTPITLTEVFPVGVRATGASITYNVAVLVFGGLAPLYNTWLVQATGSDLAPIYYVMVSVLIGLAGALALPAMCTRRA